MFMQLSQWLQNYIANNRESFLSIIRKTNLYHRDGSINEERVRQTAQYHTMMLRDFFSVEALQELHEHLQEHLNAQDWPAIATWLCMHFFVIFEKKPLYYLRLTADEQIFQCYCVEMLRLTATANPAHSSA